MAAISQSMQAGTRGKLRRFAATRNHGFGFVDVVCFWQVLQVSWSKLLPLQRMLFFLAELNLNAHFQTWIELNTWLHFRSQNKALVKTDVAVCPICLEGRDFSRHFLILFCEYAAWSGSTKPCVVVTTAMWLDGHMAWCTFWCEKVCLTLQGKQHGYLLHNKLVYIQDWFHGWI